MILCAGERARVKAYRVLLYAQWRRNEEGSCIMLPKESEVQLPLLQVLIEIGGEGRTEVIYPLVTKKFPKITEDDLNEQLPSGGKKWTNRIQWVRQALVSMGEMSSPRRGVWAITEKGRRRVQHQIKKKVAVDARIPLWAIPEKTSFTELYEEYESSFRSALLIRLNELTPRQFELFARKLAQAYGFSEVEVTELHRDGGIDGHGRFHLGLATMKAAFQCKRWKGLVGRPEVDKFRGAIQGEFEQGIFFTTSDFSQQARKASFKKGAVPIILLNGEKIVDIMINKGIGVEKVPLFRYYERSTDLAEEQE